MTPPAEGGGVIWEDASGIKGKPHPPRGTIRPAPLASSSEQSGGGPDHRIAGYADRGSPFGQLIRTLQRPANRIDFSSHSVLIAGCPTHPRLHAPVIPHVSPWGSCGLYAMSKPARGDPYQHDPFFTNSPSTRGDQRLWVPAFAGRQKITPGPRRTRRLSVPAA
jgi:hypothetical protein